MSGGFDPGIEAHDRTGKSEHRPQSIRPAPARPHRTPPPNRLSFVGIDRLSGSTYSSRLPLPLVSIMSAVQPCDFIFVAGLVEHLRVQPSDDLAAAARPERVVGVLGEHQVMRAEARADVREFLRLRVVHASWRPDCPAGKASPTDGRSALHTAGLSAARTADVIHTRPLLVEHRVVHVVRLCHSASSPQYGEGCGISGPRRRSGIANRQRHLAGGVVHGIEHGQVVGAQLERAVDRAVRVERGLRRSVETSSCRYAFGSAQSHSVMTTLRSMPRGRGGAGGTSPVATRSVQSANISARAARAG